MMSDSHHATVGVIFDLDGTLLDTLEDLTDSMNEMFERNALPTVSLARTRVLIGLGLRSLILDASGVEDESRLADLIEQYRVIYRRRMLAKSRMYPGVAEMLSALVRLGVPLAVLSNKSHEFTVPICEVLLSDWPFVAIRGAQDSSDRKPNPATALRLAEMMGLPPDHIVFVGDSTVDIRTAANAGMSSAAVVWGYRDLDELGLARPDFIAADPGALTTFITDRIEGRPAVRR